MLTSRGIALQGVGFGSLMLALQGLVSASVPEPPVIRPGGFRNVLLPGRRKLEPIEEEEALLMAGAI